MRRTAPLALLVLLVFASVAFAKTRSLTATESDGLGYSKSKITVSHGTVTLKMRNPSGNLLDHSIDIRGHGVDKHSKVVSPGGTARVTATLKKGTYTFYCEVSDHEKDGMKGTLVVK